MAYLPQPDLRRFPKLMPSTGHFVYLLIEDFHQRFSHAGVELTLSQSRSEYWILKGRRRIKQFIHRCPKCKRTNGLPYRQPEFAPFPRKRVSESAAFTYVGIDLAGPLYYLERSKLLKAWIFVYTCYSCRGLRVELLPEITTETVLLTLRKLFARNGVPKEIHADNTPQFVLTSQVQKKAWRDRVTHNEKVLSFLAEQGVTFRHSIPLAPHQGGVFERQMQTVKRCLRKVLGRSTLTWQQLETLLAECEALTNSRPLVYVHDELEEGTVISPSDFMTMNPKTGLPDFSLPQDKDPTYGELDSSAKTLLRNWKKGNRILEQFWNCWTNQYLHTLRARYDTKLKGATFGATFPPKIGNVVLLKEAHQPRSTWKLAKVVSTVMSQDGKIRGATVQTACGRQFTRTLNFLFPLECGQIREDELDDVEIEVNKAESRPKRPAALIAKDWIQRQMRAEEEGDLEDLD